MMKECKGCHETLSIDAFNINRSKPDGRQVYCRKCDNAHRRSWYKKPGNNTRAVEYVKERQNDLKKWLSDFKSLTSCKKCGENHPAVLDLHHNDPKMKETELSDMVKRGLSKKRIIKELEKCTVLCSNCHRKLHYEERRFSSTVEHSPVTGKVEGSAPSSVANMPV